MFLNIFNSIQSILAVLESDVAKMISEPGDAGMKKKGQEARELRGRLFNEESLLLLAGLCDLYIVFGDLVNIVQEVRTLPHIRYDKFTASLDKFGNMVDHFEDSDCEGTGSCELKNFHSSVQSLRASGTIHSIPILDKQPVRAAGLSVSTRRQSRRDEPVHNPGSALPETTLEAVQDYKTVRAKLKNFGSSLHEDFVEKTYDKEHIEIINTTRDILAFDCHLNEMKEQGLSPDIYSANTFDRFNKAAKNLHIPGLEIIKDDVILHQYRIFMRILVKLTKESKSVDPKNILIQLLDPKLKLYEDIQLVLHIASYAATKSSVESVMESIVSSYEYASDNRKGFREESINDVFEIVANGPSPANCDTIVENGLDKYFKGQQWHFITDRVFKKSETILRLEQQKSSLPFME